MKIFQELYINLQDYDRASFIEQLEKHLITGWSRETSREHRVGPNQLSIFRFNCFKRLARDNEDLPNALLWLTEKTPTQLSVSNIIPDDGKIRELSCDQYNQILAEFHDNMVKPLADELQITVELTPPEIRLEDKLPKSCKLFKNFSRLANKTTGSAYPLDRERWFDFIISTHRHQEPFDSDDLKGFLKEEGWSGDQTFELSMEYEFARNFLNHLENQPHVAHVDRTH
jgi:hypothetical protein